MLTAPNERVIRELIQLRRNAKSMVSLADKLLEQYPRVCSSCFYSFGLTDQCKCGKKLT